jgi:pimeloyl-ACP methyl ester carboxylesterase
VDAFISAVRHFFPDSPLFAVGSGLGANYLSAYLGRKGGRGEKVGGLVASAGVSCPFDLLAFSYYLLYKRRWIDWVLRSLYQQMVLKNRHLLLRHARKFDRINEERESSREKEAADGPSGSISAGGGLASTSEMKRLPRVQFESALKARSWRDCLNAVDVPLFLPPPAPGASVEPLDAYLASASCAQQLLFLRQPTLFIHADDDPMVPPLSDSVLEAFFSNPFLCLARTAHGGHAAFLAPFYAYIWHALKLGATRLAKRVLALMRPASSTHASPLRRIETPDEAWSSVLSEPLSGRLASQRIVSSAALSEAQGGLALPQLQHASSGDTVPKSCCGICAHLDALVSLFFKEARFEDERVERVIASERLYRLGWANRLVLQWFRAALQAHRLKIAKSLAKQARVALRGVANESDAAAVSKDVDGSSGAADLMSEKLREFVANPSSARAPAGAASSD